jgi:hypothetical protein
MRARACPRCAVPTRTVACVLLHCGSQVAWVQRLWCGLAAQRNIEDMAAPWHCSDRGLTTVISGVPVRPMGWLA